MKAMRKELLSFFSVAFGIPVLLSIFLGIAYAAGRDTSAFPLLWMYLPASGVMLAKIVGAKNRRKLQPEELSSNTSIPWMYYVFLIVTVMMVVVCIASAFVPNQSPGLIVNLLAILSCPVCFIGILCMGKERRKAAGLAFGSGWKGSIAGILLFLGLYAVMCLLSILLENLVLGQTEEYTLQPYAWLYLAILPLNFALSFTAFLGEEYGWRYFLQPILQERFGRRQGVILLGLLWGVWHLPLNLFFYSPDTSLQSILVQLACCVGMGVFMGWVYMHTENIWAVTVIHFINNNLGASLFTSSPSGVVWDWRSTLITIAIYLLVYLPFLWMKEYRNA